ncbi:MAG: hypothetical protein V1720_08190 [bacterium]
MNAVKFLFVIFLFFCNGNNILCQEYTDSSKTMYKKSSWGVRFEWGVIGGLCLGGRINLSELTSVEFSYGGHVFPGTNAGGYECTRVGVNFHKILSRECALSPAIAIWREPSKDEVTHILIGADWGVNKNYVVGANLIFRIGVLLAYSTEHKALQIYPSIGTGLSLDF